MGTWSQDIRFGYRMLAKSRAFTAASVMVLALGIGANTAIFSVADAFLLKPLPLPSVDRLAMVLSRRAGNPNWNQVSPADFRDWKAQSRSFESLAPFRWWEINITGQGEPERLIGILAGSGFFSTLGAKPLLGRTFLPEDAVAGREHVAVLSYGLWQRLFAADRSVVGRTLQLEGSDAVVIGVMPKSFTFPMAAEIWMPLVLAPRDLAVRDDRYLQIAGRLKPGVTMGAARAEMQGIAARLEKLYPDSNRNWGTRVMTMRDYLNGDYTTNYTLMLMAAVGLVLLIACANVANLQFARASRRQKEIAIRAAMGAGRWRVVRQLLVESVLVSFAGGAVGLLFAGWGVSLILAHMPPQVARFINGWQDIGLDARALLFTALVALACGVISGIVPAWKASRPDLHETLKEGGRGNTGARAHRLRNTLVVLEVALAVILLVGAGLLVKGFRSLLSVNQDLRPDSLLTMQINMSAQVFRDKARALAFYDQSLARLGRMPEARGAALASRIPFVGGGGSGPFSIEGEGAPAPGEMRLAAGIVVSPGWGKTLGVRLLSGREFDARDNPDAPRVAMVSEGLARRYWPGKSPLGHRVKLGPPNSTQPWLTVVGVCADVRYSWFDKATTPTVYLPYPQAIPGWTYLVVRVPGDPLRVVPQARRLIAEVEPEQPLANVETFERAILDSMLGLAYVAVMMAILGLMALVLSSVGIYGVMAYAVSERTHEIGIRMALGAETGAVVRMVLGRGMLLTAVGLLIGIPVARLLAQLLQNLIFGVSTGDWLAFGGVIFGLALVALAACWFPARRATRIDPVIALRYE